MNSPVNDGFDVELTLRTGPGEDDVVVRQYINVHRDGSTVQIPLGPPSMPMNPALELELYPRRVPAPDPEPNDGPRLLPSLLPDHHHHPLSDAPCFNTSHDPLTANPLQRHVFAVCYVDPAGLLTMTPWMSLDAATQAAEDRRGIVVAFPVVADFSSGPSMFSSGSWPAGKQTVEELAAAQRAHAEQQDRARQLAAHRDRDPLELDPPAARPATDPDPTRQFGGFFAPPPAPPFVVRPPFDYDPQDGAGVPIRITEVRR